MKMHKYCSVCIDISNVELAQCNIPKHIVIQYTHEAKIDTVNHTK